jgi:hypothetical protein
MSASPGPRDTSAIIEPYLAAIAERRIVLPHCDACGSFHWYPLPRCPGCGSAGWSWREVRPQARLLTWTMVAHAFSPDLAGKVPYLVALVEPVDAPGVHLVTTVVDCRADELVIDMPLVADFRVPVWGEAAMPVFRPPG